MKVLVTGAGGQLGNTLTEMLAPFYEVIGLNRDALDITDVSKVTTMINQNKPAFVINAAAYTAVDKAENDSEQAHKINKVGPENLAKVCQTNGIPLIHISTDYVFNGEKKTPYTEDDCPQPINVYGDSKWQGEEAVRSIATKSIILRVSWVFGLHGNNFVKTIQRLSRERKSLKIVNDQQGCPTATENISKVLLQILDKIKSPGFESYGTYHYCDSPATNWHAFAEAIIHETKQYESLAIEHILPIPTADYPTPAKRQKNSQMDCSKIREKLGIEQYSWQSALKNLIKDQNQK